MSFPVTRMLRIRQSSLVRTILSETTLKKSDLIYPIFINEALEEKRAIEKMVGIYQHSLNSLLAEAERIALLGIKSVILFGIPQQKDNLATYAYSTQGIVQQSIRLIKEKVPDLLVIADCCLCEYTSHGHCGIMHDEKLDNDETLLTLQKIALSYAESGVDIIAPSGMMDGKVQAIRTILDRHSFGMVPIMSYSVKYASQFYGPFREAAGSADNFKGDRKHHQLAPTQKREALREALLDVEEGADFLMVKPSLPYLDIIHLLKEKTLLPLVAYHTSGEYAMIKSAAQQGLISNELEAFREQLVGIKRAGADLIITYYADEIAKHLD